MTRCISAAPGLVGLGALLVAAAPSTIVGPGPFGELVPSTTGDGSVQGDELPAGEAPGYWLYVAAESSDEVFMVHFDPGRVLVADRIAVGYMPTEIEGPHGLTVGPEGEYWYLSMAHGNPFGRLYKYTTGTNEPVGWTELGLFPATMQISEATGLLYCVNFDLHGDMSPSSVSIVDPEEMVEVARTTTGPMPHGSRITPDGMWHYSCAMMSSELFEIDAATFEVTRVLDFDPEGDEAEPVEAGAGEQEAESRPLHAHGIRHGSAKPTWVQPHPDGERLYVCLNGQDKVLEVDRESWTVSRTFETARAPYNLDVSADGEHFVVTYKGARSIGIWDVEKGEELAKLRTTNKVSHGVVISPDGRYAFVTSEGIGAEPGALDVFDMESHERVATVTCGLQAGGIAFWKEVR